MSKSLERIVKFYPAYDNGKPCYCDCGFLFGSEVFDTLVSDGEDAMWKKLEEFFPSKL